MGKIGVKKGLGISEDKTTLHGMMADVIKETGARKVVLGEHHMAVEHIRMLQASLPELKKQDFTKLSIELGTDMQPVVDRALAGDATAQRDLRRDYNTWFNFLPGGEAPGARYDLIFDAAKAGMKVECIDLPDAKRYAFMDNHLTDNKEEMSARMAIGDKVMSDNIAAHDDGQRELILVGYNHSYRYNANGPHLEQNALTGEQTGQVYQSVHGGIDERLRDKGIPATSIDFHLKKGNPPPGLEAKDLEGLGEEEKKSRRDEREKEIDAFYTPELQKSDGHSQDYKVNFFREYYKAEKSYASTAHRTRWDQLAGMYDYAAAEAFVAGDPARSKGLEKTAESIKDINRLLDNPTFQGLTPNQQVQQLGQAVTKAYNHTFVSETKLQDAGQQKYSAELRENWLKEKPDEPKTATWRKVVEENRFWNSPESEAMWKRAAVTAPAAQPASSLGQATDVTSILDQIKAGAKATPAPEAAPVATPEEGPKKDEPARQPVRSAAMSM